MFSGEFILAGSEGSFFTKTGSLIESENKLSKVVFGCSGASFFEASKVGGSSTSIDSSTSITGSVETSSAIFDCYCGHYYQW